MVIIGRGELGRGELEPAYVT